MRLWELEGGDAGEGGGLGFAGGPIDNVDQAGNPFMVQDNGGGDAGFDEADSDSDDDESIDWSSDEEVVLEPVRDRLRGNPAAAPPPAPAPPARRGGQGRQGPGRNANANANVVPPHRQGRGRGGGRLQGAQRPNNPDVPQVRRFIEMARNDNEEEWDSDEMGDESDFEDFD